MTYELNPYAQQLLADTEGPVPVLFRGRTFDLRTLKKSDLKQLHAQGCELVLAVQPKKKAKEVIQDERPEPEDRPDN